MEQNKKLEDIVKLDDILDQLQECAKCGLAHNDGNHKLAKKWVDIVKKEIDELNKSNNIFLNKIIELNSELYKLGEALDIYNEYCQAIHSQEEYLHKLYLWAANDNKNRYPKPQNKKFNLYLNDKIRKNKNANL